MVICASGHLSFPSSQASSPSMLVLSFWRGLSVICPAWVDSAEVSCFTASTNPQSSALYPGASIWIKWLGRVAVARHGHKYCTRKLFWPFYPLWVSEVFHWLRGNSCKFAYLFQVETFYTETLWIYKGQGMGLFLFVFYCIFWRSLSRAFNVFIW